MSSEIIELSFAFRALIHYSCRHSRMVCNHRSSAYDAPQSREAWEGKQRFPSARPDGARASLRFELLIKSHRWDLVNLPLGSVRFEAKPGVVYHEKRSSS